MTIKLALLFLFLSLSLNAFALYGAKDIKNPAQFAAVVSLHLNDPNESEYDDFCSGVLVSSTKILTTGHCVEVMGTELYEQWNFFENNPAFLKVKVAGKKVDVADVILAPTYAEAQGFEGEDLAMIVLKKPVTVKPYKILPRYLVKKGLPVTLVAGGKMAETSIITAKSYAGNLVSFMDGSKAGVCGGDSGGAMLVQQNGEYFLAGLLSAQTEGCYRQTGVAIYPRFL